MVRGSNPGRSKRRFYSLQHPYRLWSPFSLL